MNEDNVILLVISGIVVLLLVLLITLILTIKQLGNDIKQLKKDAIEYNYATYMPDSDGNVVFKWKENK